MSHKVERLRTTTVSFPVVLFHSKSNQTGIVTRGNSGIDIQFLVAYAISTGITSSSNMQ